MLFLGGVPLKRFLVLIGLAVLAFALLSFTSPYRMARLTAFLNPWADQFNSGYQLTQALIAFGRGGIFGSGLGNGIQKLLYLPEPHTDFLFAVIAEELGLVGGLFVLAVFFLFIYRIFSLGKRALMRYEYYPGFVALGIGLWIAIQTLINIGVNIGVLPTKGLTLPLMSYGGNSLLVCFLALGILFRIDYELRQRKLPVKFKA
jgi:cell division protein FtsW